MIHFKKIFILLAVAAVILLSTTGIFTQESREIELTAQGILARVDRILDYPKGLMKGRITHIKPNGESHSSDMECRATREDFLFSFRNKERGEQVKILYNLSGEDIWVYLIHSVKLYHKLGIDKFDPVLMTNFSYIDISNADYQSNYTAEITGEAIVKEKEVYVLRLVPIFKGGAYGLITIYAAKDNFLPLRIDFHDHDKAIFKFMTIAKVMEKDNRIFPIRYDMMDIRTGTLTVLSFFSIDEKAVFDKSIFRSETLGEQ